MTHERLIALQTQIADAARQAGRDPSQVTLIAVSKFQSVAAIQSVLDAGHRAFGENYMQESMSKWVPFRETVPGLDLHFIGKLQSNKALDAVRLFNAIHTLDRESLAVALAKAIQTTGKMPRLFIQVNVQGEAQKGGLSPAALPAFLDKCRTRWGLDIAGLMCLPQEGTDPAPVFRAVQALAATEGLTQLSMGMSGDFPEAIAAGATYVRIGTALFGTRPKKTESCVN